MSQHPLPQSALFCLLLLAAPVFGQEELVFEDGFEVGGPYLWSSVTGEAVDYLHANLVDQSTFYTGSPSECSQNPNPPDWGGSFVTIDPASLPAGAQVALYVNVHVERSTNYDDPAVYDQGIFELDSMAGVFEDHGAFLTVNVQDPFLDQVESRGDSILANLHTAGHGIALHFHETEQLGPNPDALPPATWATRLAAMKAQAEAVSGATVRGMSGGNTYSQLFTALELAGLDIKFNYKEPGTQRSVAPALTVTPYYPSAWGSEAALLTSGGSTVLFLPQGVYPLHCTSPGGINSPVSVRPFDYTTRALEASLRSAVPGKIQVHGIVFSLNRLSPLWRNQQIALWNRYFTEVLDPLATAGVLRYASDAALADEVNAAILGGGP